MKLPHLLTRSTVAAAFSVALASPAAVLAATTTPDHVVTTQTLQQQVERTTAAREQNIKTVTEFLSTPFADKVMHDAKVDPVQVRTAIPTLSDAELSNLSSRATNAQQQFAAGYIGPSLLTLIILGIVVIIIVAILA